MRRLSDQELNSRPGAEPTVCNLIRTRSNDYTDQERVFLKATGQALTCVSPRPAEKNFVSPMASVSIVIPSYNGHRTLPYVLRRLRDQLYRNFELVLVDDGSVPPIQKDLFAEYAGGLNVKLVRARTNLGYSAARNVGIQCAEGEVLVLMDDDLLAPRTVTLAAASRHQHVEKMIFLAFRENADWATFTSVGQFLPELDKDWRWVTTVKPRHVRLSIFDAEQRDGTLRIIEESNHLKNLGFGTALGVWDLPTLICSHGLSIRRLDVIHAGGFVEQCGMNHWGVDDLSFGATMIASGLKVAPALEWRSWHLDQEGREATRAKQFAEFLSRWPQYIRYLNRRWPSQGFPMRQLRLVSRLGDLEELEVDEPRSPERDRLRLNSRKA
jgi:hypothetical protein